MVFPDVFQKSHTVLALKNESTTIIINLQILRSFLWMSWMFTAIFKAKINLFKIKASTV